MANKKHYFIVCLRLFLGLIFFTSGMAKLLDGQFPGIIGPVWLEEELAKYQLGWYARFIAYSHVFIGLMVLTQRYATIGNIMMTPLIMNILVVTISLQWRGTPYLLAFLLLINIVLLFVDFHKLKPLFPGRFNSYKVPDTDQPYSILWLTNFSTFVICPVFYHFKPIVTYCLIIGSFFTLVIISFTKPQKKSTQWNRNLFVSF